MSKLFKESEIEVKNKKTKGIFRNSILYLYVFITIYTQNSKTNQNSLSHQNHSQTFQNHQTNHDQLHYSIAHCSQFLSHIHALYGPTSTVTTTTAFKLFRRACFGLTMHALRLVSAKQPLRKLLWRHFLLGFKLYQWCLPLSPCPPAFKKPNQVVLGLSWPFLASAFCFFYPWIFLKLCLFSLERKSMIK